MRGGPLGDPRLLIGEPRGPMIDQRGLPMDGRGSRDSRAMETRAMETEVLETRVMERRGMETTVYSMPCILSIYLNDCFIKPIFYFILRSSSKLWCKTSFMESFINILILDYVIFTL